MLTDEQRDEVRALARDEVFKALNQRDENEASREVYVSDLRLRHEHQLANERRNAEDEQRRLETRIYDLERRYRAAF